MSIEGQLCKFARSGDQTTAIALLFRQNQEVHRGDASSGMTILTASMPGQGWQEAHPNWWLVHVLDLASEHRRRPLEMELQGTKNDSVVAS